ncbi:MAG: DUF2304 domain-containing protein [Candidatus Peribacteraceae bacterium]|nr:DUF2304 domain-containing protein [Candidatus Peribacteraceae bacterium]
MTLTPYQIVAPIIALTAIVYAWNLVMRQKKTVWEAFFWTVFWSAVAAVAMFPSFLAYLSTVTGIENRENAVIFTALGILFFMVFYMIIRLEELERRQTKIVREMALREAGLGSEKLKVNSEK